MDQEQARFQVEHQADIDLRISDPAFRHYYGIEAPGKGDRIDGIFYDILLSPAGLRSLGVNQLSKSETEEIYEGSTDFKRWQHVAGVYRIVRHFSRLQDLDDDTTLQYALVASLPDLGHGVKSHITDMLKEGMGGSENFHEERTGQLIELGGLSKILDKYQIDSPFDEDGKICIEVPEWIECSSPDLSVDRLHYINNEISLLFPNSEAVRSAIDLDNFVVQRGRFAFKDIDHARVWAKAANLCSSEHWNDPTNRLIELLSLEAIKRTISLRYLEDVDSFDNGYVGSPEDYTFLIDEDFDSALEREALSKNPDIFMSALYSLIQSIAHGERQRFVKHKRPAYEEYIADHGAREYPNALINPHRAAFGILPAQVEILDHTQVDGANSNVDAALQMADGVPVGILKKLKIRQFDPLILKGDEAIRLSVADPNFRKALEENGQALNYVGAVALHANPRSRAALIEGVKENETTMSRLRRNTPLSLDQIRGIISNSSERALRSAIHEGRWIEL
jgi:hypothetical protein